VAYSAAPDPLAGLRGTLLLRGRGEEGKGEGTAPLTQIPAPDFAHLANTLLKDEESA